MSISIDEELTDDVGGGIVGESVGFGSDGDNVGGGLSIDGDTVGV